jgi:hypothetical protein
LSAAFGTDDDFDFDLRFTILPFDVDFALTGIFVAMFTPII